MTETCHNTVMPFLIRRAQEKKIFIT
uniref:Uncharacterized protein n=1 Tax=Arundo donax TaxID=35708 RepID=A0A0A9HM02_ARUDO